MTPCIESTNNCNLQGYPRITFEGKVNNEHRIVYMRHNKLSLASMLGLVVRHKCDNRKCINPDHLELGTQKDNCQDKLLRGRPNGGGPKKVLTAEQVKEIRADKKTTQKELARLYGVSQPTINNVKKMNGAY